MNSRQYVNYECGGMNKGFAPFLPYRASNGVSLVPTTLPYPRQDTVLYFATTHGVIHPDCGVNWDEPQDSDNRLTKGAKYAPLGTCHSGYCTFEAYGVEALEKIAAMVARVHKAMAADLVAGLEGV